MANLGRELVGWTDARWRAVQGALDNLLPRTANCSRVVPRGPDRIGDKAVIVPNIVAGPPLAYGPDVVATPVHLYMDVQLDDGHVDDEQAIIRLIEAGASQLGALEDQEIIRGGPALGAPAPVGRVERNPALQRGRIGRAPGARAGGLGTTQIAARDAAGRGVAPTGQQIITAITNAKAGLEAADRPGPCGLLLYTSLLATLRVPAVAGAVRLVQQVEELIGSSEIRGTSALDRTLNPGEVCGILLRLEPPAIDIVHTQKPAVTPQGRAGGLTVLRIEEEIVVRVMDQAAVHRIEY
jgi:hypothetical protein